MWWVDETSYPSLEAAPVSPINNFVDQAPAMVQKEFPTPLKESRRRRFAWLRPITIKTIIKILPVAAFQNIQ
jgi:hypothetical protein